MSSAEQIIAQVGTRWHVADQNPVDPTRFLATAYAAMHDEPGVTRDDILARLPPGTRAAMDAIQSALERLTPTIDMFLDGNVFEPDRAALHAAIIEDELSDEAIANAEPRSGFAPTFIILGGRGASGKSWFRHRYYRPGSAIVVDADEIKRRLPEYQGWNAAQVHDESGFVVDAILTISRDLGLNVVLDKTMKSMTSAVADVEQFRAAGYSIEAYYMFLPRQEAARRAVLRYLGPTQRYVPIEVILSNTTNEAAFDAVRALADKWAFYDNNVRDGDGPIRISGQIF